MVTGDNNIRQNLNKTAPTLNSSALKACHAVINLRHDGFSALICNREKTIVLALYDARWNWTENEELLISRTEEGLVSLPYNVHHCLSLSWIFSFQKFTLIPDDLYTKGTGQELLNYTCKLQEGEHIYTDVWSDQQSVLIYALPQVLINWLKDRYAHSLFMHSGTALSRLYRQNAQSTTYAHLFIENRIAELFVARNGRLLFYNSFPHKVEEDLVYFLLFALEQSGIPAPEIELQLSGKHMRGDKLEILLRNYIGDLRSGTMPDALKLSPNINLAEMRQHINLAGGL